MAICRECRQLVEDTRVLCPHCYAPVRSTQPLRKRPMFLFALFVILAALAWAGFMFVSWWELHRVHR